MTTLEKEILQFRENLERQWAKLIDTAPCRNERILEDGFVLAWRHRKEFTPTPTQSFAMYFLASVRQAQRLHGEGRGVMRTPDEFELLRALRGAT